MFTPNELKEISFDKAVFGGYDIGDVDKLFTQLCEDYATLFKENTMLKKKLKLLADTVEDYRSVDEAMRKALITAQNMANEMIADAEKKSREMLTTASEDAKSRIRELTAQVEAEEKRLLDARRATMEFIDNITAMFASESEKFSALKTAIAPTEKEVPAVSAAPAEEMSDTIEQIARSLEAKIQEEEIEQLADVATEAEPAPITAEAPVEEVSTDTIAFESDIPTEEEMAALEAAAERPSRRRRAVFENLRFGTDYDIIDDE